MGNGAQGVMITGDMGHMGNGAQGQLGTRAWGTWAMGYGPSNVSECQKMSSCQKDVKCQKIKHLDYGGGSQKKEIDTMRFTHIDVNFDITYDDH